jgi:hypothetical protein
MRPLFVWLAEVAPLWVWAIAWGARRRGLCLWQAFCRRDRDRLHASAIAPEGLLGPRRASARWLFGGDRPRVRLRR